jgi:hypothetical protein
MKLVNAIANLTYMIEKSLEIIGISLFNLIPGVVRKKIVLLNNEYKSYRNRFLGIGEYRKSSKFPEPALIDDERGDVPGWVLVVLMTTGLVTALWTIAAPRLSQILKNSLDSMNNIR